MSFAQPSARRVRGGRTAFAPGSLARVILGRVAILPVVLLGIVAVVFLLNRAVPGDPAQVYAGGDRADPEVVARLREQWGLDRPLLEQFFRYLGQLLQGDLGWSFSQHAPVVDVLAAKIPATVELTLAALLIGIPIGLALGIRSARSPGSWVDHICRILAIGGISVPIFWLGLMLAYLFGVVLGWFPISGRMPAFSEFQPITGLLVLDALLRLDFPMLGSALWHLFLPAVTLAVYPAAVVARFARSSYLDVFSENYIRTARAFGIRPRVIVGVLATKNAVLPLINLLGLLIPSLIVGAVLVEIVFSWPGIGRFLLDALLARDYIVVQSVTLLVGVLYVLLNLTADILHAVLDPRTRKT
jgi:ABC-type dipeptide/oligopeptide/nickel transport systems, permease components